MRITSATRIELYHRLADGVGSQLLAKRLPLLTSLTELLATPPRGRCAVYVAVGGDGTVLYAGSVRRAEPGAVATRVREHLRMGVKAATWDALWILPVRVSASVAELRRAEGRVVVLLGWPPQNRAMPSRPPSRYW